MSRRYSFWRFSASVCVGLSPGFQVLEWELLPVATAQLTPIATFGMHALTYKTERGRQDRLFLPTPVSFVRKRGSPIPRRKTKRVLGQMARSNFRVRRLWIRFLHAALIPGHRVVGQQHNLGTSQFRSIRPRAKSTKNWSRTFLGNEQ